MMSSRPIIVVTGANGGVGYGICERLLIQLAQRDPPDTHSQLSGEANGFPGAGILGASGLTLIMACRSVQKAEAARTKLYSSLDAFIARKETCPNYDGYASTFRQNVKIDIHYLDLAAVRSVFKFANAMSQKYPYISHLICNAGVASFTSIDWIACLAQLFRTPVNAVTAPEFYLQNKGEISADSLGWVWQCNVFGHYVLFRALQQLLSATPTPLTSRVLWMSSLEASPKFYGSNDWQLVETEHSYEASKYQIDLIGTLLDRRALQESGTKAVRHFVVQPGVCSTNISNALIGSFLDTVKVMVFYLARFFGSPHHTIEPYKAAVAAVHLSLVSLSLIPLIYSAYPLNNKNIPQANGNPNAEFRPVRFGSQTGRWGEEHVGITEVKEWGEHEKEGLGLLDKCEECYQTLLKAEGQQSADGTST